MSSLILAGDTSGAITLTVPTSAGTNTITLPAATGTAITTASTSGIPGTVNWTTVQTSSVSPAVAGVGYPMNTTSGALTVTLPASPTAGNLISIVDYAGTFATNNLTLNPNGNKIEGNTSNRILSTNREAVNLVYIDSTQGWLAYSDVYSTTGPLPLLYTASYLIVAGGGGATGGGGGAGGYLTGTTSLSSGTVYTATVGAGGAGTTGGTVGNNGSNSSLTGITTAIGGGGGGLLGSTPGVGQSGGSGGGAGSNTALTSNVNGGAGTSGQGNAGGATPGTAGSPSGGGGGAGAAGQSGVPGSKGGDGGNGLASSITGSSVTRAGGGAGGGNGSISLGTAGSGGGGAAGGFTSSGSPGTANTGGGGGCTSNQSQANTGGSGGSGVIIISVPTANYSGTTTGSPTITTSGGNTIMQFNSSGTYTA